MKPKIYDSWIRAIVHAAWRCVAASTHGVLAAALTLALAAVILPWLQEPLADVLGSELTARQAWWAAGATSLALTGVTAGFIGLIAGLSAVTRRARARPVLAGAAALVVGLQVPWLPLARVAVDLSDGHIPHREHLARLLPAGDYEPPTYVSTAPVLWPVSERARVTSGFGWRWHPILGERRFHNGVDIAVAEGTTVQAAADGLVQRTGDDPLNGLHVVIIHPDGLRTAYCHLSAVTVTAGAKIQAGEALGASGSTGRASGPHLHFGAWHRGHTVDPLRLPRRPRPPARSHAAGS